MKKTLSFLLAFVMLFSLLSVGAMAANTVLSAQKLTCEGKSIECEKYNIDGSNYFKLRDIAYLLNGTVSQFSVGWDSEAKVVSIVTGEAYEPNGSELVFSEDKSSTAVPSSQTIKINGITRSDLSVYNIGGSNFFKLRDLGGSLGFLVDYDKATNTAVIKSLKDSANPDEWLISRSTYCSSYDDTEISVTDYTYNDMKLPASEKTKYAYDDTVYSTDYVYDAAGNLISETYSYDGGYYYSSTTEYTYDANGNVLTETGSFTDNSGTTVQPTVNYAYTSDGKKLTKSCYGDGYGYKYEYTYNANGDVLSHSYERDDGDYSYSYRTEYAYDAAGNCISETDTYSDGIANTTYYTYDAAGNCISSEYNSGSYSSHNEFTYDANGNLLTEIYTSSYTYDGETSNYSSEYTYEYDAAGNCISQKCREDDFGFDQVNTYYDNGNMASSSCTYSDGAYYSYIYNSDGNLLDYVYESPYGSEKSSYSYDALGNCLSVLSIGYDMEFYTVYTYDYVAGTYTERTNEMIGYGGDEEIDW